MRELCDDLLQQVPDIMAEWTAIAAEEPWLTLPEAERLDNLPRVVLALIDAAICEPGDGAKHRENVYEACTHGNARRVQGFEQELLLREYHLLREAVWRYLMRTAPAPEQAHHAIIRLDMAITVASRASLYGYHRRELEEMGRWPEVIESLHRESPLLTLGE